MRHLYILALTTVSLLASCQTDPDLNEVKVDPPPAISFEVPANFPAPVYSFQNNPLTPAGFALGKKLFFDNRLSRDNSTSCGSCHIPAQFFAQREHPISHGVEDKLGTRNSPALYNLAWHTSFFWDGGVNHLESQPINPITNPVEMDETLENVVKKVGEDASYRAMFRAAFGDETVNTQRIFRAFAQYMATLVSANSKFDKYSRGEGAVLTAAELRGFELYKQNCQTCHKDPLFMDNSFRNNGLRPNIHNDSGRAHITRRAEDLYKFKVPSLRNLSFTEPYMHDGSLNTLEDVLDHYSEGIVASPTLDTALQAGGIRLTAQQKSDIIVFLKTLDDEQFRTDVRFKEGN